jgi:predicted 3-demethylubiquinone-9 3-methyltransferase (glyoxalase superfamily)
MKKQINPCLWFDGNAKEAAEFYCSAFKSSEIKSENQIVVSIEMAGQKFICINGGPIFKMNPSISFFAVCETENELDAAWSQLTDGGNVLMELGKYNWSDKYGWVQDKFGASWQLSLGKREDVGQKFTPFLMFTGRQAGNAKRAIDFYTSVFDNSSVTGILEYTAGEPDVEGTVKHAQFKLNNQVFMAMDSSLQHNFGFNEAVSLMVECDTQEQIDYLWEKLSAVPEAEQCGWLKDQFGVSWQIIPSVLEKLMNDPTRSERVVQAFMKMKKFDIEVLENA